MSDLANTLTNIDNIPVTWIKTANSLNKAIEELTQCQVVAFDTEFIKRDTYYPTLALIQVNTGNNIYLIDAPIVDLQSFWQVLTEIPTIIWHSCHEDLSIFYLLSGLPALNNVFDTQIAITYLTGKLQMGYQQALKSLLDIDVDKAHSQSDWLARPLSHEQEVYAIDDVRYLLPLYYKLQQQPQTDKIWEDCQTLANEIYQSQQISDDEQYISSVDFRHNGEQRLLLKDIIIWREQLARTTNRPKTFILRKQGVRELADVMPTSLRQLRIKTSIHRSVIDTYGNEILKIVKNTKQAQEEDYPPAVVSGYRSKNKTLHNAIKTLVSEYSELTGIPSNILMKKKWQGVLMELVALHPISSDITEDEAKLAEALPLGLTGWRYEWIIKKFIPLLQKNQLELRQGMGID